MKKLLVLACMLTSTPAWADLDPCVSHFPAEWAYPSVGASVPRDFVAVYQASGDDFVPFNMVPFPIVWAADDDSTVYPTFYRWTYKEDVVPVLMGDAAMQTWVISQAATGYVQWWWWEGPTSEVLY